jgi:hypothetical protein
MKHIPNLAAALLGLLFLTFGSNFFFQFLPMPPGPPKDHPASLFMGALVPTGYMAFVKVFELLGGLFVIIPRTRSLGLLLLGPVIVNIVAFHVFFFKGATLLDPVILGVIGLSLFVLWTRRADYLRLVGCHCEP